MARSMRLFLIRHGETVDNVAQRYAGVRDSPLTCHGFQQATRLGQHFRALELSFTHIFSSNLQRTVKTAGQIREAQMLLAGDEDPTRRVPDVVQLPVIMERDFGSMEGKKPYERTQEYVDSPGFVAKESKESLARRANVFLDDHLLPLLEESSEADDLVVAIVSHGIFLSSLWRCLLLRLPHKSVTFASGLMLGPRVSLEQLGGWSNTGFLELLMTQVALEASRHTSDTPSPQVPNLPLPTDALPADAVIDKDEIAQQQLPELPSFPVLTAQKSPTRIARGCTTTILTVNGKDHLQNLKRAGGGFGTSRHDASQKSIQTYFKRRKLA
ncbi:phosphoglycerate mutase-like protein [Dothidotthia symphoricarpi CBS 119687]|uniref:Phosphoglycerate mutase-like protein n=1 Tax=Dothidotthia symphoricarpi CBS 119687 TaxID=1392245 RepID=A0A6A6AI19_9PLEO|nr:phosphoglycerate mutase-like protein [Dothidotthia symphoricarpi CBS 119687]KAF2130738.1 phosphoglycerate mutase-like protein [Dothidotthia symphoricarpi CBS 119687]